LWKISIIYLRKIKKSGYFLEYFDFFHLEGKKLPFSFDYYLEGSNPSQS
jgi:hypothetical protein